jgi:polyhydroxybutyrate depolymerase
MMLLIGTVLPVSGRIIFSDCNKSTLIEDTSLVSDNTELKWMSAGEGLRFLRSYWIHIPPSYDGSESVPLVLLLHGSTGVPLDYFFSHPFASLRWLKGMFIDSCWTEDWTNFSSKADEGEFILVYPNGLFSYFTHPLGFKELLVMFDVPIYPNVVFGRNLIDDVGFIQDLIEEIQLEYNIDSNSIFISGVSNGADMTYYLGSVLSDTVAAISPVAGYISFKNPDDEEYRIIPEPENPVSVIVFHGTLDYYDTDELSLGVNESVAFWVEHNNCNPIPDVTISESGNIITRTYTNGDEGTEVVLYTIVNGTHTWPGNEYPPDNPLHDSINEISATDIIWDFFESHPKQ